MSTRIKKVMLSVFLLFLILCLFILIGIKMSQGSSSQSKMNQEDGFGDRKRLILGFSQIGSESAWRTRNTQSIIEAAEASNIQLVFDDAQQKQANQLKAIRSFIVYQVDVIAFVPIVEDGWDNVLQEAKEAGIPVIIVDRQINTDPSLYAGFLGEDAFEEGVKAATFLLEKCRNEKISSLNIMELSGTKNSSVAAGRAQGFRSVLQNHPEYNIIYSEDGDFLRSFGKEICDNILKKHDGLVINGKKIQAIYSHNDSMTLGMLDSFWEHNISPSSVIIISVDGEQRAIDALIDGRINCVVECNPNLGTVLMDLVQKVARGEEIPRTTFSQEKVFTENDDFSLYEPRGY